MARIRPNISPASYNPVSGDTGALFPPGGGGGPLPPSVPPEQPPPQMPDFAGLPQMQQGAEMGMGGGAVPQLGGAPQQPQMPLPGPPVAGMPGGGAGDPMRDALMQILGGKVGQPRPQGPMPVPGLAGR